MKELKEIQADIKNNTVKPIYAFDGEEAYYIDLLCDEFEKNLLQPHEKDFNQTIFYGKDTAWNTIVNECRSYPAFANRRLVIVKEAQQLKEFTELDNYFQQPAATTVLVIAYKYKKIDGRINALRSIKRNGAYYTFDKLKDFKLGEWIRAYCASIHRKISVPNADLIAAHLGNDLQKIANEIEKTAINVPEGQEIAEDHIERYIGISKDYNIFQYPAALMERNAEKAFKVANYFMANSREFQLVVITATVYSNFAKLYQYHYASHLPQGEIASLLKTSPYYVKDYQQAAGRYNLFQTQQAIQIIHQYNLYAVGMEVAKNDLSLLKEMTAKIISL
jgi:DNA polymerase III subunit delta